MDYTVIVVDMDGNEMSFHCFGIDQALEAAKAFRDDSNLVVIKKD